MHKLLILTALAALTLTTSTEAQAVPPSQVRGIDLNAVLAMYDKSRETEVKIQGKLPEQRFEKIRTIVLDPGHGGGNQGALGVAEIHEKYLTLELAYALRDRLQRAYPNVRVVMTRYWDQEISLSERITFANLIGADVFLSLHYNAATHNRAIGFETYYLTTEQATPGMEEKKGEPIATAALGVTGIKEDLSNKPQAGTYNGTMSRLQRDLDRQLQHSDSGRFARAVNSSLAGHLDTVNRGVKQANFGVLRGALMPAIVVESGFVTHQQEGEKVITDTHRIKLVEALTSALVSFDQELAARDQK